MEQRSLQSFDGTRIVYWVGGAGERWLVIANGYGGTLCAWTELFEHLAPRYRLLLWDYRGLHRSERPADASRLSIADQVEDLWAILAAESVDRFVLGGWSVGVQVALEAYHQRPELIEALLLIHGAPGRVLSQVLGAAPARLLARAAPLLLASAAPLRPWLLRPLGAFAGSEAGVGLASAVGVCHGRPQSFGEAVRAFLALDAVTYLRMVLLAEAHDAESWLPSIRVPTLVTAGDRDLITPPRIARATAAQIPGACYFEVPGGTHYSVMEFPRLMANRIDSFLECCLDLRAARSA